MLAITGNAILVATEQQAPCFFFFWRVRPHAFEKGDLRIQRTCLLAWWAWMFVLELRIHSEDHILEPLALALEPESANERNKILWLRITCTVCLEWSCCCAIHRGLRESCAEDDAVYCPSGGQDWKAMLPFHFTHYGPSWCVLPHIAGWKLRPHELKHIFTQVLA